MSMNDRTRLRSGHRPSCKPDFHPVPVAFRSWTSSPSSCLSDRLTIVVRSVAWMFNLMSSIGRPTSKGTTFAMFALWREAPDASVLIEDDDRDVDGEKHIEQIVVDLVQLLIAVVELVVDRRQLFVADWISFAVSSSSFVLWSSSLLETSSRWPKQALVRPSCSSTSDSRYSFVRPARAPAWWLAPSPFAIRPGGFGARASPISRGRSDFLEEDT